MPNKTRFTGNLVSDNNIFVDANNYRVGIGTTNPTSRLHVVGDTLITGILTASNIVGTSLSVSGISTLGTVQISSGIITATSGIVTYYGDGSKLTGINAFNVITQSPNSTPVYPIFADNIGVSSVGISTNQFVFIPSSGNLGIGTTNPTSRLHVVGDTLITGILTANRIFSNIYGEFTGGSISGSNIVGTSLSVSGISTLGTVQISSGIITATSGIVTYYGDGSKLTGVIASGSAVSISTNTTNQSQFLTYSSSTGSVSGLGVTTSGLVFNPSTTRLGIGTTNPLSNLHVVDGLIVSQSGAGTSELLQVKGYSVQSGAFSIEDFNRNQLFSVTGDTSTLFAVNDSSATTRFVVGATGNTGIGTTNPTSRLHVVGDALISGILTTSNIVGTSLSVSGISTLGTVQISSGIITATSGIVTYYGDGSRLTGVLTAFSASTFSISTNTTNQSQFLTYATGIGTTTGLGATSSGLVFNPSTTRLGIGTTNPLSNLHVVDGLIVSQSGAGTSQLLQVKGYSTQSGAFSIEDFNRNQLFSVTGDTSTLFAVNDSSATTRFVVGATGNTGIGTTNPTSRLHVVGDALISGILTTSNIVGTSLSVSGNSTISGISTLGTVQISSGIITATSGIVTYYGDGSKLSGIDASSIIGLGSFSNIQVAGISTFTNGPVLIGSGTSTGTGNQRLQVTGNAYVSGNTGIGTTNPLSNLHVVDGLIVAQAGAGTSQLLQVKGYSTQSGAISIEDYNRNQLFSVTGDTSTLFAVNDSSATTRFVVGATGNTGIGTTNPTSKLHVVGDALISGVTTTGLGSTSNPLNNSSMSFELTNNTTLTIRVRGTDGIIRTGIVTLS